MESSPCQAEESIFNTLVDLCASFHELDSEFFSQFATLFLGNSTLVVPIALVPNENLVDALGSMLFNVLVPGSDI